MKKKDIEILQSKTISHQQTLAKEGAETNEMQAAITSLTSQREAHLTNKETLQKQIAETQRAIDTRVAAQRAHAQKINAQSRFNVPELDFWTSNLCMRIEGAGINDRLKFVYTHVDERDWHREVWFELDMGKREYEVVHYKPKLEKEKVERVVEKLNETRELAVLLKGMRKLFVEALTE